MTPFRLHVEDDAIEALRTRLGTARWPDEVNDEGWSYGMRSDYLRELTDYWRERFDWRAAERAINAFDQFVLEIDGLDLHFIHARSPHATATPLILTHGWPGSMVEFLDVIPRLIEPERFGGLASDAFHVVCPSLPGYACSAAARVPGMHPRVIATRHAKLVAALGYKHYIAQGGDWGSPITRLLAELDSEHCRAVHFNALPGVPPAVADPMSMLSARDRTWLADNKKTRRSGMGYYHIQSTRPQTLAYALGDSPLGLCAWMAEKFHFWCDCERNGTRDIRNAITWDRLLTNISLYWYTGTIASSIRLYREFVTGLARGEFSFSSRLNVPTGYTVYPGEISKTPRPWAEHMCDIVYWHEANRGGHFAAMEQPRDFAEDLWRFHRVVRDRIGDISVPPEFRSSAPI